MNGAAELDLDVPVGTRIGGIVVERRLAEGGMGTVYLGRDERLQRAVAIKAISTALRRDPEVRARFLREARVLSRLKHPNICEIYGYEETADSVFLVLEYIDGTSLRAVLESTAPLGLRDRIASTLAEVLQKAHGAGVVHRDLKPENVMLTADGAVKVLDFGIARLAQDSPVMGTPMLSTLDRSAVTLPGERVPWPPGAPVEVPSHTRAGSLVGTPRYMAPEQARGEPATPASDIYALGLILLELYTGRGAHPADLDGPALLERLRTGEIEPPAGVPGARRRLVARLLSMNAHDRPTATEVAQELRRIRELPRRRLVLGAGLAAALALTAAGTKYLVDVRAASARVEQALIQAVHATERAEHVITDQYEEQGRQALLSGDPLRALVYLSEAYGRGARQTRTRLLLGRATRVLDKQVLSVPARSSAPPESSPDGSLIATTGDGVVEIFDADGHKLHDLVGHTGKVWHMRWLPGDGLATSGSDGTVRVWAARAGTARVVLRGHTGDVLKLRASADGRTLISGGFDRTLRVWDLATGAGRVVATLDMYPTSLAMFPDGRTAAFGNDHQVALVDLETGRRRELRGEGATPLFLEVTSDGGRLLMGDYDGFVRVWRSDGKELIALRAHPSSIWRGQWSADGKLFVTASQDRTARVWDGATGALVSTMVGHEGSLTTAELDGEARRVVTASTDGTAAVWDAANGRLLARLLGHGALVRRGAFASDGRRVMTVGTDDTMRFWTPTEDDLAGDVRVDGSFGAALLGSRLVVVRHDGDLALYDTGGALVRRFVSGDSEQEVPQSYLPAVSPDGAKIVSLGARSLSIWSAASGDRLLHLPFPARPTEARFSPDGTRLLVALEAEATLILDAGTGAEQLRLPGGGDAAAWGPDGQRVATADAAAGAMHVHDARTGALLVTVAGAGSQQTVSFSPDGTLLASAGRDSTVKLWSAADGTMLRALAGHVDQVCAATFSPDQQLLASASYDGTARIWDVASGKLLYVLAGHTKFVFTAVWSAGGDQLVTASNDGHVRTWDLALERREPAALARLLRCRVPFSLADGLIAPARTICE